MSSIERAFEPWEEIHRHGQDLADRLAQGFTGLISHSPTFKNPFEMESLVFSSSPSSSKMELFPSAATDSVSAILDIGSRIGQAGAEFGAGINGMLHQFFRQLPQPFRSEPVRSNSNIGLNGLHFLGLTGAEVEARRALDAQRDMRLEEVGDEDMEWNLRGSEPFRRTRGSTNVTLTYDSRSQDIESTFVARGDLWRIETSSGGGSASGNQNAPLLLVQLGPVLFVRDSTFLLPVHLSKQHLLWYGYDRKNGVHSLCPAVWSKHRRWLMMSMVRLNPVTCSFLDLQFPNGQLTYVAGEGLSTSAFLPVFGGLLQAQGRYPGETKFSFSCKNKRGTRITPFVQWPDKSVSLELAHPIAWKRSGLMVRPSVQFSICPTIGGSNPGLRSELIHSVNEDINLIYGYACDLHPSAYAAIALGRSKWNGNVGTSGAVLRAECPLSNMSRPFFSIQLNGGFDF